MVNIGMLRVVIMKEREGAYFAQGLEFDYGTEGKSLSDVKARFHDGFRDLLAWRLHGSPSPIQLAGLISWNILLDARQSSVRLFTDIAPYEGIRWFHCFE